MEPIVNVNFINDGQGVSNTLLNKALGADGNLDIGVMRPYIRYKSGKPVGMFVNSRGREYPVNNATLRKDEWIEYDKALVEGARMRLVGIADLQSRGLVYNMSNGFGKTVLEYEDMTDINDAEISMDGKSRGENARPEFGIKYLPLPIIHKAFQLNARVLAASRNTGDPLDTTQTRLCGMKIAEMLERILFRGYSGFSFGGGVLRGYCDFPQRITGSLTGNWDTLTPNSAIGSVGAIILHDVLAMIADARAKAQYGPFVLYIPSAYESVLDADYVVNYPKSIRARLLEISQLQDIKVADQLAANNVVLVQMNQTTVRLVNGMPLTNVEWQSEGGMVFDYKAMTIQVPQIRADAFGRCGVVHYT